MDKFSTLIAAQEERAASTAQAHNGHITKNSRAYPTTALHTSRYISATDPTISPYSLPEAGGSTKFTSWSSNFTCTT